MKFRCIISGNEVEFVHAHDIKDMYKHPGYEPVEDEVEKVVEEVKVEESKPTKKGK